MFRKFIWNGYKFYCENTFVLLNKTIAVFREVVDVVQRCISDPVRTFSIAVFPYKVTQDNLSMDMKLLNELNRTEVI